MINRQNLRDAIVDLAWVRPLKSEHTPTDEQIKSAFSILVDAERFVVERRFSQSSMTLRAIGNIFHRKDGGVGVSQERIRQIEKKALRKLRHPSCLRLLGLLNEEVK